MRGVRCEECWQLSCHHHQQQLQTAVSQLFARFLPHTHRSCPATGHGRPSDIKHGDCVVTDQPCPQSQLWQCTTHHHLSSNMGFTIIPYLKTRRLSLSIVAHSSVAATSLHLSTHIPSLTPDPCWGCGGTPVEEEHGHTRCGAEQPLRGRLVLTSDQQH